MNKVERYERAKKICNELIFLDKVDKASKTLSDIDGTQFEDLMDIGEFERFCNMKKVYLIDLIDLESCRKFIAEQLRVNEELEEAYLNGGAVKELYI